MMEIGSIIDIQRGLPETAALKPGDVLKVSVLEVFEQQRALVDLGRFRATADIAFPVAAGDELWVRVVETHTQLRLQLVPKPAEPAAGGGRATGPVQAASAESLRQVQARIDQLAGAEQQVPDSQRLPAEPRQILEALKIFLEPFDLGAGPEAIAGRLKEFCDGSGLFLELRLAVAVKRAADRAGRAPAPDAAPPEPPGRILATDLKARLLLLKSFFESSAGRQLSADSREVAGLARAAAEMLADIRAGQEQMAKPAPAAEPFQLVHFALPMPDDRRPARLKFAYRRRRAAGRPDGLRAAILLQLDRMGAVRADLTLLGRSLNISIFVSGPELRDWVSRHAAGVREALADHFESVGVQVSVSARKIAQFVTEDWHPPGETRVDVRV
jgi:hypothetical protein